MCALGILSNKIPLLLGLVVFDGKVLCTEWIVHPIAFLVVEFFPNGCAFDMLWKFVFSPPVYEEWLESSYASGLRESSLFRQLDDGSIDLT